MTEEWPHIETTQINYPSYDGTSHTEFEFEWVGSKFAIVEISLLLINQKGIGIYPWPLKVIAGPTDFGRSLQVVRKDVGWHFWWMLVTVWYKLFRSKSYFHFKWKVIKTFEIWGLAYQPEAKIIRWRNIGKKRKRD